MEQPGAPTKDDIEYFKKQRRLARNRNPIGDAGLPLELAPKSKSSRRSNSKSRSPLKSKKKKSRSPPKSKKKSKSRSPLKTKKKSRSPPKTKKKLRSPPRTRSKRVIPQVAFERSQYWKDWYQSLSQSQKNKLKRETTKAKRRATIKRTIGRNVADIIRM